MAAALSNYNHTYNLYAYQPNVGYTCTLKTRSAHYHRWPNGHSGGIGSHYFKDQTVWCNNYCNYVAQGSLNGSNGGFFDLWDNTGDPQSRFVWVDAFCFYQP